MLIKVLSIHTYTHMHISIKNISYATVQFSLRSENWNVASAGVSLWNCSHKISTTKEDMRTKSFSATQEFTSSSPPEFLAISEF